MKIAQFKCVSADFVCFREWYPHSKDGEIGNADYVRLTEWVEVEFPPLAPEVTIAAQVAVLDTIAKGIRAGAEVQLQGIERRKQELMALPAPEAA